MLVRIILIVLTILMVIIGGIFGVLFFRGKRKIDKTDILVVKNHTLNGMLSILILVGAIMVGSFLFLIY